MKQNELQQIKMAWLAAEEAGDTRAKLALLRDHPDLQDVLIDFVAAYHLTSPAGSEPEILPLTQRATQNALARVFAPRTVAATVATPAASLRELRNLRGLALAETARGLRLGVDVWKKFEDGLIELNSLGERQLARLASFFGVAGEQFSTMLSQSQPAFTLNRRQTAEAAKQTRQPKQSFAEALEKSTMSPEDKRAWMEEE
jgi:transcriptional regulator with XRE-family HTH domain